MKKPPIVLLLFLFSFETTFSQIKKIEGDTPIMLQRINEFQKTFGLKNFEKSTHEFNFRFWNQGQVIEISKDSSIFTGSITNYIYHTKKMNSTENETLSKKIILSTDELRNIYSLIKNSEILSLPTDNKIENWKRGFDGIMYTIEHSDKNKYWIKNYWTPTSQDSIPEALIVLNFVNELSNQLNLQESYNKFRNDLPKKGCYNSGGISIMCYLSNTLELGYIGATKLPFGFNSSYRTSYIGKKKVDFGAVLNHNFDDNGLYHLNFQFSKWNLLYKKSNLSDFLVYNFQNRKVNLNEVINVFRNHQIKYGLNFKNTYGIGIGLDYITSKYEKIGGHFYAQKWFSKPNISTVLTSSVFNNKINYKADILKSVDFKYRFPIRRISFGLTYEDFMNYKDFYFSVLVLL